MLLIVTNRQDQTADFLILELKRRKIDYVRFNTEDFPNTVILNWEITDGLLNGYLIFPKRKVDLNEITSIWYRRPIPSLPSTDISDQEAKSFAIDESQSALEGLWRTLNCFWVSNPDNIRKAENKLYQLHVASQEGFTIWNTVVTNDVQSAQSFHRQNKGDIVYKPLRRGRLIQGEKLNFIFTNIVKRDDAREFESIKYAPSLLQKYIHKSLELRVTVIGESVFSVAIDSQNTPDARHDWRRAQLNLPHQPFNLPSDIELKCRNLVKRMGLKFGAIDLILTPHNEFVFVEINPNGQWAWIQQLCPEIRLREALVELLIHGTKLEDRNHNEPQ